MARQSISDEEILKYLCDEWEDSLKENKGGVWLTTRAFQMKLRERGVITTWPTLNLKLTLLAVDGDIESIRTSGGYCWKPSDDTFKI